MKKELHQSIDKVKPTTICSALTLVSRKWRQSLDKKNISYEFFAIKGSQYEVTNIYHPD